MPRGTVKAITIQKGGWALFRMRGSFAAAGIGDEQIKQPVCSFRRCPFLPPQSSNTRFGEPIKKRIWQPIKLPPVVKATERSGPYHKRVSNTTTKSTWWERSCVRRREANSGKPANEVSAGSVSWSEPFLCCAICDAVRWQPNCNRPIGSSRQDDSYGCWSKTRPADCGRCTPRLAALIIGITGRGSFYPGWHLSVSPFGPYTVTGSSRTPLAPFGLPLKGRDRTRGPSPLSFSLHIHEILSACSQLSTGADRTSPRE